MRWTVNLGAPFLRLTNSDLQQPDFRTRARIILQTWLTYDRVILMRFQQFIPFLTAPTKWATNSVPTEVLKWQFWDLRPGANLPRLCQNAAMILTSLGTHLQWQNDKAAYELIPVLQWLRQQGSLDSMGDGLLNGLLATEAKGINPGDELTIAPKVD